MRFALGTPSTTATFGNEVWYYISQTEETTAFLDDTEPESVAPERARRVRETVTRERLAFQTTAETRNRRRRDGRRLLREHLETLDDGHDG